ncbi:MAG: glycosyltransferase [Gammaproteobacteria bacterium]|nr:MAG: glycosyltransferase [Gammaproteobacteria bacterium]TLZ31877.1 MAG: glycosyltransferase [Gammaproteobacteria bacterium]TLZ48834.1 MAG: glycosyltransferase [Gammaproteobacteria bacterium]
MRILHLIHSEGVYGAELILLYLAREQQQRGHEPLVGSIRDPRTEQTPFEALAQSWGLPVVGIRIASRPTPPVVRSLLRTVHEVAPDVLHSHGYKANILLGPLPRRLRGPMIATLHGWTAARTFSALWLYERLDRLSLRRIDSVVVVARCMLQLAALRGVAPARQRVIENGIPPRDVRLADLAARGVAPLPGELVEFTARRPTLVAIGRLAPEKRFTLLLEAFARARAQSGGSHQLLIVGEGPERRVLARRIAVLRLAGSVRLAGYVDGADRLLARAAGFVISSRTEGLPLALLEAMQWRVPILASAVGAIPELLDEGRRGRLVAADDLAALTCGLQSLMSGDCSAGEAIASASQAVSARYTSARMAEEYLAAYAAIRAD